MAPFFWKKKVYSSSGFVYSSSGLIYSSKVLPPLEHKSSKKQATAPLIHVINLISYVVYHSVSMFVVVFVAAFVSVCVCLFYVLRFGYGSIPCWDIVAISLQSTSASSDPSPVRISQFLTDTSLTTVCNGAIF